MIRAYTAVVALLSLSIAEGLESQQSLAARAGVSVNATPNPIAQSSRDTTAAPDSTSGSRVLHGAAIGGGIGVAVGLLGAYIVTQRGHTGAYVDHSEDGIVIIPFLVLCTVSGIIIGGVVGYLRK